MSTPLGRVVSPLVRLYERRVIRGYREFVGRERGRALLSYLVVPLLFPFRRVGRLQFSNRGMAREVPRALNELGFTVDIVDFRNRTWNPTHRYDLFVGHAGFNFAKLSRAVESSGRRICYTTGIYWRAFNESAERRRQELMIRRGHLLPPERFCDPNEEEGCLGADLIVGLGNADAARTYERFGPVEAIDNAAYPVDPAGLRGKDFDEARRHFLFFSGPGNVHKGLDRLLEAFSGSALHLHVCQAITPAFAQLYRRELDQSENIQSYGFIGARSDRFKALVRQCAWVIHPTCTDCQPGSVLECMAHGLVPVLPTAASIDLETFGVALPDCEPGTIRQLVEDVAAMPVPEVERRAEESRQTAATRYTPERFRESFKAAVQKGLDLRRGGP